MKPIDELLDLHAATYPTTKEARQIANSERWQPIRGRGSTLVAIRCKCLSADKIAASARGLGNRSTT